jgi:hypothetical protein
MLQRKKCERHAELASPSLYKDQVQLDFERLVVLGRQLPKEYLDIQALLFHELAVIWTERASLPQQSVALLEETYIRISEENGPADPNLLRIVNYLAFLLSYFGERDVDTIMLLFV